MQRFREDERYLDALTEAGPTGGCTSVGMEVVS
jgi:hypothetical protein